MTTFKKKRWVELDNAAKIFPATSTKKDSKVFRFSCELNDRISKSILQEALDETVLIFPLFLSVLRTGAFWYYLEDTDIRPRVKLENISPCFPIFDKNKKELLFRVSYFKNRINLEVYHALSDGAGSLEFLKTLVFNYIIRKYKTDFVQVPQLQYDASRFQKESDSFKKYYNPSIKKKKINNSKIKNYNITGKEQMPIALNIIEGIVSVKEILKKAREYNTTITVLLTSILIKSIELEMEERKKSHPVVISVPVNLRSFFESKSVRNFFGVINVGYTSINQSNLEDIILKIKEEFSEQLTKESVQQIINSFVTIERNVFIRPIPVFIKDYILKMAHKYKSRQSTATLSNVGKIIMPEEVCKYIKLFDAFISTDSLQVSTCSFLDNLNICISSIFENTEIQKNFFRQLTAMGLSVEISTTIPDKDVIEE